MTGAGRLAANETVVAATPELLGVKVRVKGTLCPVAIVSGSAIPRRENSESVTPTDDNVTVDPVAVRVPDCVLLVPTVTFPKSVARGVTASCPWAMPVPATGIVSDEVAASELTLTLPLALPGERGVNITVKVTLWPTARVSGTFKPVKTKLLPVVAACVMVTVEPPVLLRAANSV